MFRKSSLMALAVLSCCMAAADDNGGGGVTSSASPPPPAPAPAAARARSIEGRVLTDCQYGKCNDVVTLSQADMDSAVEAKLVDSNKGAVAYAKKLDQNQPKGDAAIE